VSDRNEKYRQKYIEAASEKLGRPVEAVGLFSRPGWASTMALGFFSYLGHLISNRAGAAKSGGLPMNVILAVTSDEVYAFDFTPKGTSVKLKEPVGIWPRAEVRAERIGTGAVADRIRFHLAGGEPIELASNKMPGSSSDFNAPVVDLLAA
jgi:hypothetical protein